MSDAFIALQRLLPKALISRGMGYLARSEVRPIAQGFIRGFQRAYGISLADAARTQPADYRSFNDFFTRELAPGARPIASEGASLVSPADGFVSQFGTIENGTLVQAKGITYTVDALLGDSEHAKPFAGGHFITVYLAPANYHRVHAPTAGRLRRTIALPGELFSVNDTTAQGVTGLFARNERLVCLYDSPYGPLALVFVGALIVASIETVWEEATSPYTAISLREQDMTFEQGAELGRFLLGSTVVLCVPEGLTFETGLAAGSVLRMGQALGHWQQPHAEQP